MGSTYETYQREYDRCTNRIQELEAELSQYSEKSTVTTVAQTIIFGLHRITNGKVLSGILFALTINGFIIWWIIDLIRIVAGKFTDQYGKPINSQKVLSLKLEISACERTAAEAQKMLRQLHSMDKE